MTTKTAKMFTSSQICKRFFYMVMIGRFVKQPQGYKAFVPETFPPKSGFSFSKKIIQKANEATLYLGRLDGITQLLPDVDFFLFMYICKDAAASSQIEGTRATIIDAIEATAKTSDNLPEDVDDILHYIQALNYGLESLKHLPLSLRLIKEVHKQLMQEARASHFSDPGNFRASQNWIGGNNPSNASFVPPPVHEMNRALDDLEKFLHHIDDILPIMKAGLIHAQFETIHPFLDGNGRTGRMLITLYLWMQHLVDRPVLFLSSYFNRHRSVYYISLQKYHDGDLEGWLDFFLYGVTETAKDAIETVKKINTLRDSDFKKIHALGKTASLTATKILPMLFKLPIVNVNKIQEWVDVTRQGAQKIIDRFVDLDILEIKDKNVTYGRSYIYRKYVDIFKE